METLTGFGGVGKTRLALRVASELERGHQHSAWFVDLAPLRDSGLVASTVAAALGIRTESSRWPASADYLAERRLPLMLDNCEHLLGACAVLADRVLRASSTKPTSFSTAR